MNFNKTKSTGIPGESKKKNIHCFFIHALPILYKYRVEVGIKNA